MMVDIVRLRGSSFDATLDDSAWRAGLNLWMSSWHQVPAASLEAADDELTKAAGLGRDVKTWRKLKPVALRGWVLCADGRLYHETVAELALEAWIDKLGQRLSSGAGNAKRYGHDFDPAPLYADILVAAALLEGLNRKSKSLSKQHVLKARKGVSGSQPEVPVGVPVGAPAGVPLASQEKGREGIEEEDADASLSPGGDEKPEYPEAFEACWKAYPHVKGRSSKPKALGIWKRIAAGRRALLPSACARYAADGREPKADCGAPGMHLWLRDQKYLDWLTPASVEAPAAAWTGPAKIREIVRARHPESVDGYLKAFAWRPEPAALITSSPTMFGKLKDCEADLAKAGCALVLERKAA